MQSENDVSSERKDSQVRPSFYGELEGVCRRVELGTFPYRDKGLSLELCKVITEVMFLDPCREMQIGGDVVPVHVVQEIFRKLGPQHLELVISNFRELDGQVRKKKAYLRAALYNSAFEIEAHYENLAK